MTALRYAIAYATLKHIVASNLMTIFATHHINLAAEPALADKVAAPPPPPPIVTAQVQCGHMATMLRNGQLVFLYKLLPGVAERSFGVHCARAAGLPEGLLAVAEGKSGAFEALSEGKRLMRDVRRVLARAAAAVDVGV
jgi:DNA mismatch repair ATPase MutS